MFYWYASAVASLAFLSREDADGEEGVLIGSAIFAAFFAGMHTWALVRNVNDLQKAKNRRDKRMPPVSKRGPSFTGDGVRW